MDLWACGLFLLMAMWAYVMNECFKKVCNDKKENMRAKVLETLLNIL